MWKLEKARADEQFFQQNTVSELRSWHDRDLEKASRLSEPLKYDAASDRYVPVSWEEAFTEIARELNVIDPEQAVFDSSGHANLEASFLYALFARAMSHQNLPHSSNICYETTSVNLQTFIGIPVGTCALDDCDQGNAIFLFGQNTGSNSPRFLYTLPDHQAETQVRHYWHLC